MKQKVISSILLGTVTPVVIATSTVAVGCAANEGEMDIASKKLSVNTDTGLAQTTVTIYEQPIDGLLYARLVDFDKNYPVELIDENSQAYYGHYQTAYNIVDGKAHIGFSYTQFIGVSHSTKFAVEFSYVNRHNKLILKTFRDLELRVDYEQNKKEEIHIFSLNDFHGAAAGYGEKDPLTNINAKNPGAVRIMQHISPIIEDHPGSMLVTAGDNNSGDVFSTAVHGASMFPVLKAMGARYSAVGNHAFEWGIKPMATKQFDSWARTSRTQGNYFLASNILNGKNDSKTDWEDDWENNPLQFQEDYNWWNTQRVSWADPYKIVNMNGHLVCLIGLTTQATLEDGNRDVTNSLSFIDYNPSVIYSIKLLKDTVGDNWFNNIESFILLTHLASSQDEHGASTGEAVKLAQELTFSGIDGIISGHSHQVVCSLENNPTISKHVWVGQAETAGRRYLDVKFRFDNTKKVGSRLSDVSMHVYDLTVTADHDVAEQELSYIYEHPATETVENTKSVYETEKSKVATELGTTLTKRRDSLVYPAIDVLGEKGQSIGHSYYINDKESDDEYGTGGYICDQLGAWINYAQMIGFTNQFKSEIEASSSSLTAPAISLINQDSMNVQFKDKLPSGIPVTLKDIYAIQTYENNLIFGYITIWQLANAINFILSGKTKFNYSKPEADYYEPKTTYKTPTPNNLTSVYEAQDLTATTPDKHVICCQPEQFKDVVIKDGLHWCLYPCGPVQWYGFRFEYEDAPSAEYTQTYDREYKLKFHDTEDETLKEHFDKFPNIWILDPLAGSTPDKTEYYRDIRNASPNATGGKWLSAEEYYKKYDGYIPMVTNNFLYDGGNCQTTMFKPYMEYNEKQDKRYAIQKFSQITRDMLVVFANLCETSGVTFDMPIDDSGAGLHDGIVKYLATYVSD